MSIEVFELTEMGLGESAHNNSKVKLLGWIIYDVRSCVSLDTEATSLFANVSISVLRDYFARDLWLQPKHYFPPTLTSLFFSF